MKPVFLRRVTLPLGVQSCAVTRCLRALPCPALPGALAPREDCRSYAVPIRGWLLSGHLPGTVRGTARPALRSGWD